MQQFRDNILRYGSFGLVFFAPLVFWSHGLFPHISTKTFFVYGVVEVLFFLWLYSVIFDKTYRLSIKSLIWFIPLIVFVSWMTLAGIFAVDPGLALWSSLGRGTGLLTLYHTLAFSFIVASLVKKNGFNYVVSLFQYFVASSFILAISVWMGTEGFNLPIKFLQTDAGGGLGGNSTLTAGYLLFTLAMSAFLLSLKSLSKNKKWLIGIIMAVTLFSPVFINLYGFFSGRGILGLARGTILALLTGLIGTGLSIMFLSGKKWLKNISVVMFLLCLVIFGFLWVQLITPGTYLHQNFEHAARGTRFILWDAASIAMSKHPVLGYGPENFYMAFEENFNPQVLLSENSAEGWVDRAHNIYYDLGVTGGYPAIGWYSLFILSLFCCLYKLYKNNKLSRIQASIVSGLLVAHIANHLFTFESNLSLLSLFTLAGILYALDQDETKKEFLPVKLDQSYKNIVAALLIPTLVIIEIFFVYQPIIKSKAYAETFAAAVNKRGEMYPKLLTGSPVGSHWDISDLAFRVYRLYASNPAQLKNDKQKSPYLIKDLEALLYYLYKVSETNKTDYRLYLSIASLENTLTYISDRPFSKDIQGSILAVLEKARSLSPTNPNVYWIMAQTKIWGGDFKGVEEAYMQAIIIAPHFSASYDLALKYAKIVGNQKLYDKVLIQAKENIPGYELK